VKKSRRPQQHTALLMLPITHHRAEELSLKIANPAASPEESCETRDLSKMHIELLLGIAAIEDAGDRQLAALCAAQAIFYHTNEASEALMRFVSDMYGEDANTHV
jgi:hypothetical protein